MDDLKSQGIRAFLWDFFGKFAQYGMSFAVTIFLARLLEPSDFGLVAMVAVIIAMAQVFTDIGLGSALVQRRHVLLIHYSSVFYFGIAMAVLLSTLTFFSASLISGFYANQQLVPLVKVMSVTFILGALSSVHNAKLKKELNYALMTKVQLVASFTSGMAGIALAFYGAGVWSLVVQSLVQGILYTILIWTSVGWRPSFIFSWKALRQLWGFGFRVFVLEMMEAVFSRLDYVIIGKLFSPVTLGFFQRAKSLDQMIIQYSSGSLMNVLFPLLSRVQNDLQYFQSIVIKALGAISIVTFFLLGIMYLSAGELIVLLYSDKWLPSVAYFKLLVLSGFAYPVSALLVNVLGSRGNSKVWLRLEIYKKLIAVVTLSILYFWEIEMFLYALIVQGILAVSLNIHFASQELRMPYFLMLKPVLTQGMISIAAVMGTILINRLFGLEGIISAMTFKIACFAAIFLTVNRLFRTPSYRYVSEELQHITRLRKRENQY